MNPAQTLPLERLAELSARHPELAPYLMREMSLRARRFMNGVTLYRNHPTSRDEENAPIVWQSGTTVLRDYSRRPAPGAPTILAVPALINRFTILDLHPQHSLLHMLGACGFRVFAVDWDVPSEAEKSFSLGDYVTQRLVPVLNVVAATRPAHVLGYCMGGLLALALANLCPDQVRSLTLLATPWDFEKGFEAVGQAGNNLEEKLKPWLATEDPMPVDVIQSVFAAFQPMQALHKFSNFAAKDQSSIDAVRFVLAEDWLNDGVPLTANAARECFGDMCMRNVTARGVWQVGGRAVEPHNIKMPVYAVVPGRDRIVPPESAMPLARALPHAVRHEPMLGHIGIMASPVAPHQVWTPMAQWLATH